MPAKPKVVVAMSGGVDSAVAAALLLREGYDCIGVFMRLGNDPAEQAAELVACSPQKAAAAAAKPHHQGCCSSSDAADARYVAGILGIPFYALNFQHDFSGIIDYFVREYNRGRTPNPCVRCNETLKFGKLSRYARAIGADFVATGHYARIGRDDAGAPCILRAVDAGKDQSYVLFGVPPEELPRMLLPIGDYEKSEIRSMAQGFGLPVHDKPDSQEICFVPDNDYAALVAGRSPGAVRPGPMLDTGGRVVGQHGGHQHFTLGQRRGVGVAFGYPIYVTGIDPVSNSVTVGPRDALLHRSLTAREVNWLAPLPGPAGAGAGATAIACTAKVRYNSPATPAVATFPQPGVLRVQFNDPVAAITPGQAVACYDGPRLLGGGWIDSVDDAA